VPTSGNATGESFVRENVYAALYQLHFIFDHGDYAVLLLMDCLHVMAG